MRTVVIERKKWLRGTPNQRMNFLLDTHGNQCCIGVYLSACGVPDTDLLNVGAANRLKAVKGESQWLVERRGTFCVPSDDADDLYNENDHNQHFQRASEKKITALFAKHDVEVKFTGSGVPDMKLYQ